MDADVIADAVAHLARVSPARDLCFLLSCVLFALSGLLSHEHFHSSPTRVISSSDACGVGGRRGDKEDSKDAWVPVTKLGRLVKSGKITSMEEIYLFSLPVKDFQIVDM